MTNNTKNTPIVKGSEILLKSAFDQFLIFVSKRLDRIPILMIGEDSVRYDFFSAVSKTLQLNPWDMQLEYPIHDESYIPRLDPKSKRKEKPQIDLVISTDQLNAGFEFGLFRRNSNPNGKINKTGRTLKMINDFVRLGLHSYYTKQESFFICVADSFMLKHQMDSKVYDAFPAVEYGVSFKEIEKIKLAVKTTDYFDERFFKKAETIKLSIFAALVCELPINAKTLEHETKILVWKISTQIKN